MNSLGSCISTFGKCKKFNPKNELGNFLDFYFLTTFALWKFGNFLTLPNAELVHNDINQKIQFNANFTIKGYKGEIYTIMKTIVIPIPDFQEVIFLDLETLPKLVFTILVSLQILQANCEFSQTLVFCPEP